MARHISGSCLSLSTQILKSRDQKEMDCGTLAALPCPLGMASPSMCTRKGLPRDKCSHGDWRASRLGMLAESNVAVDLSPAIHSTRHKTLTDLTPVGRIAFAQIPRHPIFSVAGVIT